MTRINYAKSEYNVKIESIYIFHSIIVIIIKKVINIKFNWLRYP